MNGIMRTVMLGLRSIRLHFLRSILTMLGILFGVGSVISMLAFGEGTSQEAQDRLKRLGSTNIILKSIKPTSTSGNAGEGQQQTLRYGLKYDDAKIIRDTVPNVRVVVSARDYPKPVRYKTRGIDGKIRGTVPWFPLVSKLEMLKGRFFSDIDEKKHSNVCVLTPTVARKLFLHEYPVGKMVKIDNDPFTVIGVIEEKTGVTKEDGSPTETNFSTIYIPLSSSRIYLGEQIVDRSNGSNSREDVQLHEIQVQANELKDVIPVSKSIRRVLSYNHSEEDYEVKVPLELIREAKETAQSFKIFLALIASVSLLVGGIGIMNIMLASVTERTREIGVRRALGARKKNIIAQFLVETITLSSLGGALGILVGISAPPIIEATMGQRAIVLPEFVLLSFGVSALVGVVFGLYPAIRAASLDPIEALRHE